MYIVMRNMLRSLLTASPRWGLFGIVVSFLLCLILTLWSAFVWHVTTTAMIFLLPMILVAWFFKRSGVLWCVASIVVILIIINTIASGGMPWPSTTSLGFWLGSAAFLVEGTIIGSLRYSLELAQIAHHKAQEAEALQRQVNQVREQFLVNVTHELRTPLTELYGYLELLRDHREQLDPAAQTLFLNHAIEGCEELQRLVNNVLDAAHMTSGVKPPRLEAFSLIQVVQEVLPEFGPQTRAQYDLCIDIPDTFIVRADRDYTRQVLRNLLSNAFKYVPAHTTISISATVRQEAGASPCSTVCLCIKDTGPGIPPAEMPLLFEKFTRLQRELTGTSRGTGLGLYISKQLLEVMRGHIWAESSGLPGEGSAFYVTLPLLPSSATAPQRNVEESRSASSRG